MRVRIICSFRERDSADTGAPGSPRLNLDHNFAAEILRRRDSFLSRLGHAAAWNLKSVRSKNGFALVFG
jgi:hypothetical protein